MTESFACPRTAIDFDLPEERADGAGQKLRDEISCRKPKLPRPPKLNWQDGLDNTINRRTTDWDSVRRRCASSRPECECPQLLRGVKRRFAARRIALAL